MNTGTFDFEASTLPRYPETRTGLTRGTPEKPSAYFTTTRTYVDEINNPVVTLKTTGHQ